MPTKKKSVRSKDKWFKPVRGSYLPNNASGWLTYIPFIAFLIVTLVLTRRLDISQSAKVYFIAVQWVLAGFIMTSIAKQKS